MSEIFQTNAKKLEESKVWQKSVSSVSIMS